MSWRDATPSSASAPAPTRRGAERTLTLAVLVALAAALAPVTRVVDSGGWVPGAVVLAAVILAAGFVARSFRLPAIAVSLIEVAVWAMFMTLVYFSDDALLWIFPTPETVRAAMPMLSQALNQIAQGAAPLEATLAISALIVGAMGLLTIVVDHVVLTARMPLLASVGIVAVSLIPAIAVEAEVDVFAFVLLAVAILFLLRAETRAREKPREQVAERTAGVPATAFGIAAISVIVAVVASPLLPATGMRAGTALGPGPGIDATLQLGDDLRRPAEVEVLRYHTDASAPPYLRATTLTRFEGDSWEPDPARSLPLESELALGALAVDEDVTMVEHTTTIEVVNLASYWLPIPWAATEITGLQGSWAAVPANRTVVSRTGTTQGQNYLVASESPRPSREQIREMDSRGSLDRSVTTALPEDMPEIIAEVAAQVTADADTDYDALIAMQRWFRSGEFTYSLDAPVDDGFDGSGADAVATFLEVKEGYCVHFASAFALMARSLDMPTRVVVGYLPGVANGDIVDGESVFTVSSRMLHAWPEVYFEGAGWIAFEPTAGLGTPTSFLPATFQDGREGGGDSDDPLATPTTSASPGANPRDLRDPDEGAVDASSTASTNPLPVLTVLAVILVILTVPFLTREVRQRRLIAAGQRGDAGAAWLLVQDAAIDAGIPVPASESPRVFATRLIAAHGAPADATRLVVSAIERASYAHADAPDAAQSEAMTAAALEVHTSLMATLPSARRVLARVAPRSLIIRPGSVYAGTVAPTLR